MFLPRTTLRTTISQFRPFSTSTSRRMRVVPVPVRSDNYAYLLIDDASKQAAAVDPYDMTKVQAAAQEEGVQIIANLTTHHHYDHSGGNKVCSQNAHLAGFQLTLFRIMYVCLSQRNVSCSLTSRTFKGCSISWDTRLRRVSSESSTHTSREGQ